MALFSKKTWTDRIVEFAGRRKLIDVTTGKEMLVDVERAEGAVSQAGDAFSAANMNNLEQRIYDAFGVMLTATLNAGATSVSFTDAKIKSTSIIDPYTDKDGLSPKTQTISGNTLTMTFEAQNTNVGVMVIVREG